jgi:hypothetical protein
LTAVFGLLATGCLPHNGAGPLGSPSLGYVFNTMSHKPVGITPTQINQYAAVNRARSAV